MTALAPVGYLGNYHGVGQSTEPLNTEEVTKTIVEPGSSWTFTPWLDAALTVSGIPSDQAGRVPQAVRAILESVDSDVDRVVWGGGEGLESIRGKVYVRWRPDKPYNAVDYANVARRLFMRAAEGFPSGARLIMNRYRIDNPVSSDLFVYPTAAREIPASAPEAARATTVEDLPAPHREADDAERRVQSGLGTGARIALGVGGGAVVFALGAWWFYKGRKTKRRSR